MFREPWSGPYAFVAFSVLILAIAMAFAWDISSQLTEQRVRGEKTAEYHQGFAEENIEKECFGIKPPSLRDCIHKQLETARDHERAEQDLDAQQQMAIFTRVMGWTAVVGLGLGVVSIAVIYSTLREMGKTNKIMREQSRAWVAFETISTDYLENCSVDGRTPENGFGFNTVWRNFGQSPVVKCRLFNAMRIIPADAKVHPEIEGDDEIGMGVVAPQSHTMGSRKFVIGDDFEAMAKGEKVAVLYGFVNYMSGDDITIRKSRAIHRIAINGYAKDQHGKLQPAFEVTAFGEQTAT